MRRIRRTGNKKGTGGGRREDRAMKCKRRMQSPGAADYREISVAYAGTPLRKRLFQGARSVSRGDILTHVSQILHTFRKHNPDPFARHGRAQIFPKIALGNELARARCATRMERGPV